MAQRHGTGAAMEIGGYRIDRVIDGEGVFGPTDAFPDTTAEQWQIHDEFRDGDGQLPWAYGGFLLRGHGRTVLVDLGFGPGEIAGIRTGGFLAALRELGTGPDEVTDVLFTHLHVDHVGWASVDGIPQFPKARLWCDAADHHYFVEERQDGDAFERLDPCQAQLETFGGSPPLPGITTIAAPGHTPGSTIIVISGGTQRVLLLGDVVHCPVQLVEAEWNTLWDVDPDLARRTRERLVREFEGDPSLTMAAGHFPGLRFGRLLRAEGRRQWTV